MSKVLDQPGKMPSPSGGYTLHVERLEREGGYLSFKVLDGAQAVAFEDSQGYPVQHRTLFCWDTDESLWTYSGDLGLFWWSKGPKGWARNVWLLADASARQPMPPCLLQNELRHLFKDPCPP